MHTSILKSVIDLVEMIAMPYTAICAEEYSFALSQLIQFQKC
jgi:hypothetical protein